MQLFTVKGTWDATTGIIQPKKKIISIEYICPHRTPSGAYLPFPHSYFRHTERGEGIFILLGQVFLNLAFL